MAEESIKVATVCMNSSANKNENIEKAEKLVREAAKQDARWVVLPEVFTFIGPKEELFDNAELEGGPTNGWMSSLAKELGIYFFAGTMGERNENGKAQVFNTLYVWSPSGEKIAKYRKAHLFDLYDDSGKVVFSESERFVAGNEFFSIEIDGYHVGLAICFDLRFSEMFLRLNRKKPLDVIILPAAFTYRTGKDHWELLLRGRATEQQAYILAANQTGKHSENTISYGHSMIVDPWGKKLADTGSKEGIAVTTIWQKRLDAVRARIPVQKLRRPELY